MALIRGVNHIDASPLEPSFAQRTNTDMSAKFVFTLITISAALFALSPSRAQQAATPNPLDAVPEKMPFDIPYGAPISLERAEAAIAATVSEAKKRDWKLNIAVV